jgi:hypothetical protein
MASRSAAVHEHWLRAGLPCPHAAVVGALHLRSPQFALAQALDEREWSLALDFADRSGLTLFLARDPMPETARRRVACSGERNRERLRRLRELYAEVTRRLQDARIPFVFLNGLTQCDLSGHAAECRAQYDIDLLTSVEPAREACAALHPLGFVPFYEAGGLSTDHLPPLIRKTGWQFRGDYFDPAIPTAVEVHFRLWDQRLLRLAAPGIERFWERRDSSARRLAPPDALGYSALHLLKHLLLGSVRPFHVYELACILERQRGNAALWREWRDWHAPQLRQIESVAFRLAHVWFGCELPRQAAEDWAALPPRTRAWFDEFSASPLQPANKNELWLHFSLLVRRWTARQCCGADWCRCGRPRRWTASI